MSIRSAWPLTRKTWLLLCLCCPQGGPQGAVIRHMFMHIFRAHFLQSVK